MHCVHRAVCTVLCMSEDQLVVEGVESVDKYLYPLTSNMSACYRNGLQLGQPGQVRRTIHVR